MSISPEEYLKQYDIQDTEVAASPAPVAEEVDAETYVLNQMQDETKPKTSGDAVLDMLSEGANTTFSAIDKGIRWGFGVAEAAGTISTGIVASVAAGVSGLVHSLFALQPMTDMSSGEVTRYVQEMLTYSPKIEEGQKTLQAAGLVLEPVDDFFRATGEAVQDMSLEAGIARDNAAALGAGTYAATSVFGIPVALKGVSAARSAPIVRPVMDTVATTSEFVQTNVKNVFTTSMNKAAREQKASSTVIREIADTIPEGVSIDDYISKYERLKEIPGYEPTLPEVINTDMLVGRQRVLSQQEKFHDSISVRHKKNLKAIQDYRIDKLGGAESEGYKLLAKVNGDMKKGTKAIADRIKFYEDAMGKIKDAVTPSASTGSKYELGEQFRVLADKQYKLRKLQGEMLYMRVGNPDVPATSIVDATKAMLSADQNLMANMPSSIRKFNALYADAQRKMFGEIDVQPTPAQLAEFDANLTLSFDGLRGLKTAVGEDKAIAVQSGNFQTVHHLKQFEASVDDAMSKLEATGDVKTVQAYREATNYWRNHVAVPHYEGMGALIFKDPRRKGRSVVSDKIGDKFLDPSNLENIRDFKRIYADSPEAMDRLILSAAFKLGEKAVAKDGLYLDPTKYKDFMNKHWQILNEVPLLKSELSTIEKANTFLNKQRTRLQNKLDIAAKTEFVKKVKSENIQGLVTSAIEDHTKNYAAAKTVLRKVGADADAKYALSRFVVDKMIDRHTRADGINYGEIRHYMRNNKKSLDMLLTPEHTKKLDNFLEAWDSAHSIDIAPARQIRWVGDVAKEKFGQTFPSLVTQWRAISHGRQGVPQAGAQITSLYLHALHKNTLQQLEYAAFYDAPVMETLHKLAKLKQNTPDVPPVLQKQLNNHIKRLGIYLIPQQIAQEQARGQQ